jgi:ketosteroid isomerase-like protein
MSAEDIEAIKRGIEAYNAGDLDGLIATADPEVRFTPMRKLLEGGEYIGHEGLRQFVADMDEEWAERGLDVEELRDLGDRVLVLGDWHAIGRDTGTQIRYPVAWLCEMKGGRLLRMRAYSDRRQALAEAGLGAK